MAAGSLATTIMATLSVAARSVLIFNLHCLGSRAGIIVFALDSLLFGSK